jgi:glycosyltransferase involved in cell wall biosynthesis
LPHVVTLHDVFLPRHVARWGSRVQLWLVRHLLAQSDVIISVTNDVQDNLLQYLPGLRHANPRLVTILNGIDVDRFSDTTPTRSTIRDDLGIKPDVVLVGFLGRFMEQKGFLVLVQAIDSLMKRGSVPRFQLIAVGSGDFRREYQREVEQRGLTSWITFVNAVTDAAPILRQLDLLAMPSLWEAAPLLAMEAMVSGVPVLGSDCIGLREILRNSPSVTVPTGDVAAWANALSEAVRRPWADAARAYAPEAIRRFDVRTSAAQLLRVMNGVTTIGNGPSRIPEMHAAGGDNILHHARQ